MNMLSTLRRSLSALTPAFLKPRRKQRPSEKDQLINGYPENLSYERLNQVCVDSFNSPLRESCYTHLSAWKESGAYRLFVTLEDGRQVTMVFKDAIYDSSHIPALERLPILPGPPEFAVFRSVHNSLSWMKSSAYMAEEIIPRVHYQYLLEDLSSHYHKIRPDKRILSVIELLPAVHKSLADWQQAENPAYLIDFGPTFQNQLFIYVRESLTEYIGLFESKNVTKVLGMLDRLETDFHEYVRTLSVPLAPIHGDLNYTNIFIHNDNPSEVKLVDWEWAGVGLPHADLVSLLKGTSPDLETQAFRLYASVNQELSLKEHERLYHWCKIERGLLDAGFLAAQVIRARNETNFSLHSAVSSSLNRVFTAYQAAAR